MGNELVHKNDIRNRLDTAVQAFFDKYTALASLEPKEYPDMRHLVDWLDDFQAFLDIEELQLPVVHITPAELMDGPEEKLYENHPNLEE